jgi:hypothetical protein
MARTMCIICMYQETVCPYVPPEGIGQRRRLQQQGSRKAKAEMTNGKRQRYWIQQAQGNVGCSLQGRGRREEGDEKGTRRGEEGDEKGTTGEQQGNKNGTTGNQERDNREPRTGQQGDEAEHLQVRASKRNRCARPSQHWWSIHRRLFVRALQGSRVVDAHADDTYMGSAFR